MIYTKNKLRMYSILLLGPLPPPVTGNSLAVKLFYDALIQRKFKVEIINLSKRGFKNGIDSIARIGELFKIFTRILLAKKSTDSIYFTISESKAGNLKDILVYVMCYKFLPKMYIHLHGGAGYARIMSDRSTFIFKLNAFFLKKLAGVIVLGRSHGEIFKGLVHPNKIKIVPNFSEDEFFLDKKKVEEKFKDPLSLNFLFLSNLIDGKGHLELIGAMERLNDSTQKLFRLDIAGGFDDDKKKEAFLARIKKLPNIKYHGVVKGEEKKKLLNNAHVFFLPTYYPYEGQPISILEAYASGCAVVTTNHSGIFDVFKPEFNGFEVEKKSIDSILTALDVIVNNMQKVRQAAINNVEYANSEFRTSMHLKNMFNALEIII